jgi:hypothetical protein
MMLDLPMGPRVVVLKEGWFFQWVYCWRPRALDTIPVLP